MLVCTTHTAASIGAEGKAERAGGVPTAVSFPGRVITECPESGLGASAAVFPILLLPENPFTTH